MNVIDKITKLASSNIDEVVGLKLTTGEYIIGSLSRNPVSGRVQYINKPVSVASSGQGIVFMPWVFSSEETFELEDLFPFIIVVASVPDNMCEAYMTQTGQRKISIPASARGDNRILVN